MRTKNIFSTLVLAAFAAACSNEELELGNNSNELANGRFEIGQVELALGDGAESRYAVGPNFNDLAAEAGDELGAALIDTWNGTTDQNDFKYDYSITDYIQTNYSFKYDGETWASEAKMVEGNYFFYAPYNAKHVTRAAVTAKFNPVQQLALNANGTIDELSTIKQLKESGEVMAVGYKFISREDGKTVKANLLPIYAYPLITLKNNFTVPSTTVGADPIPTDLVIKQIVISNASIPTEATFNFGEGTAIATTEGVVAEMRDFTYWVNDNNPAKALKGNFAKNNGATDNYTADLLNDATKSTSAIVVKAPANYTLKAGATTKFHVVMPAAKYENLTVELYTNKGVFKLVDTNLDLDFAAGKRYDRAYYNADGTLKNDAEIPAGENLNFTTGEEIAAASGNIVTSASDLAAMIQSFKATDENDNTLAVTPLTEDVEINAAVMTAVKAKSSGFQLNVTAPATISANLNSSNKTINFLGGAVVKTGEVTINKNVEFTGEDTKLNVKGGTVTVEATFNEATLEVNGGEVTLKSDVSTVVNKGKLTIAITTISSNLNNNGGEITFVAGADAYNVKSYSITGWVRNDKGTMTIPAHTTLDKVSRNSYGDNKAVLNVDGTVTNVITNNAKGTINVNGTVTAAKNKGLVVMGSSSAKATVTTNEYRINNTNNGTVSTTTAGIIYYEFTENVNGKLVVKSSNYNTIILNGMTWAPEAIQTLSADVIMKDATIEIWDADADITISGTLNTENSDGKKSYLKGVVDAVLTYTAAGSVVDGITPTGATLNGI